MNADPTLDALERIERAILSSNMRPEYRWLDAEAAGAMLGFAPRTFAENIACLPDFPKPLRVDGTGFPRWRMDELQEWANAERLKGAPRSTRQSRRNRSSTTGGPDAPQSEQG